MYLEFGDRYGAEAACAGCHFHFLHAFDVINLFFILRDIVLSFSNVTDLGATILVASWDLGSLRG